MVKHVSDPRSPSRRTFLKTAATGGLAVYTPYILTSKALGDATTPPASDRIVMGGIGVGNMGSGDQGAFLGRSDVQYVAVCDVRRKWRDGGKARTDGRYGNKDCAAYRAGKDVYLQKPETLTLREGPLMIAAARRYGRVVSGGSQRVLEDYKMIVEPCWAGEVGTIRSIDINVGPPSMACYLPAQEPPPDIDWDLWLGPAPWEPYNPGRCDGNFGCNGGSWRSYVDYSGGSLTDWGAHNFGGTIFAADLLELQPSAVTYHPVSADGRDAAYVSLDYPNGVALHCNRPQQLRTEKASVSHDRGIQITGDGQPREAKPVPVYRGTGGIYGDFIESVKTRERPFRDIEPAVNTMTAPHLVGIAPRSTSRATTRPTGFSIAPGASPGCSEKVCLTPAVRPHGLRHRLARRSFHGAGGLRLGGPTLVFSRRSTKR